MAGPTRIDLWPRGQAVLLTSPGQVAIDAQRVLMNQWVVDLDAVASVVWYSSTRALFRSQHPMTTAVEDDCPTQVAECRIAPDVVIRFRSPLTVPFRRGRTLWPRRTIGWVYPTGYDRWHRTIVPPPMVRAGLATSLSFRTAGDRLTLKRALEATGIAFTEYGTPD